MKRKLLFWATLAFLSNGIVNSQTLYVPGGFTTSGVGTSTNSNVGIGTAAPYTNLSLGSSLGDKIALWETNPSTKYGFGIKSQCLQIFSNAITDRVSIGYYNGGTPTEDLTITGGKIGINTITPYTSLSLGSSLGDKIALWELGPSTKYGFGIKSNCLQIYSNASSDRVSIGYYNSGNPTENLCVVNGRVGIGTISPSNTLDVNGTIHAREVKVDLAGWSDFVFHPSYQLKPLTEVEKFIQTNGHLEDIPSAEQVEKEGVNVGEMQKKLLQKVEELTLYVIELEKRNSEQSRKIEDLQKENEQTNKEKVKMLCDQQAALDQIRQEIEKLNQKFDIRK